MARRVRPNSPFEEFEAILHTAELENKVKYMYRRQGRNILQIGGYLFPRTGEPTQEDTVQLLDLIHATGDWLAAALHDAEFQVQNITYIQTLGPFTVRPEPDATWAIYKQMVELVVK